MIKSLTHVGSIQLLHKLFKSIQINVRQIRVITHDKNYFTVKYQDEKTSQFSSRCCGLGAFLRWWPPSTMWAGPLIFFYGYHRGCLNNPIFSNLGLCAACWAHFMCHHELWPTSVSQPFSFLNSSLGLAGGKYYQKITIPVLRLVIQNLLFQVTFLIFFSIAILSPYILLVGLLLQYVALFQSVT